MKNKSLVKFVGMVVMFWFVSASWAAPLKPVLFYSKAEKGLFSKSYTFRFSLWDAETGGTKVWEEEKVVKTKNSVINTYLGEVNPLGGVDFGQALWVQVERKETDGTYVQVGEMDELVGVPYAMWALTPAGPQGAKGEKGDKGDAGPQGPKGDTGAMGATGSQGPQGPQGATGAQGIQGPMGPIGPQGLKGDTGATGAQGAAGHSPALSWSGDQIAIDSIVSGPHLTGPQGSQGPAGPPGPSGASVFPIVYTVTRSISCAARPDLIHARLCPEDSLIADRWRSDLNMFVFTVICKDGYDTIMEVSTDQISGFGLFSHIDIYPIAAPSEGYGSYVDFTVYNGELWAVVGSVTIKCIGLRPR